MRIAVVVSTYPPYKGGMGNVAAAHVAALKRAGHDVTVLAPGVNLKPWLTSGNAADAPQLLWKLRGFEAVELHYPFYGGAEWVWLWKKLFGKRARLSIYYHMDNVGRGPLGVIFRLYRKIFLKRVLRSADVVMVSSRDYLKTSHAAAFADDPRVVEVPIGIDTARFHPDAAVPKDRAAVFVGALDAAHYFKGVNVLLEAFALVKRDVQDAKLRIVGNGEQTWTGQSRLESLGIENRVELLGRVSDEELPDVYRRSLFHVLPSVDRSEAFGLVTLEAGASGIPSVVSDLPGVRSVIEPGVTGFTSSPKHAGDLAKLLKRLFTDAALCARMGAASRERVVRMYDSKRVDALVVDAVTGR